MTEQFERVANIVSEQIAKLLRTRVLVRDERGVAIASSEPDFLNQLEREISNSKFTHNSQLKVHTFPKLYEIPICFSGNSGEIVIAKTEEGENISPRLAKMLVEMVVNQTVAVTQLPSQQELKNKFVRDLLGGAIANESDILRQGRIFGIDLYRPCAIILVDATDYILLSANQSEVTETTIWQRSQNIINSIVSFFQPSNNTIFAYIDNGEIVVIKASSSQDLITWANPEDLSQSNPSWADLAALKRSATALLTKLQCDTKATINIGIGRHHPGIQGLTKSYQDARAALSLGRRLHQRNQVHCLAELGIAVFVGVSDEVTKMDLANHLVSPLEQEPDLLKTTEIFFQENCCPSSTAKQLSIHRNTLSYRLDKIASLTGLDPRQFDEAIPLRLAILLNFINSKQNKLSLFLASKAPRSI